MNWISITKKIFIEIDVADESEMVDIEYDLEQSGFVFNSELIDETIDDTLVYRVCIEIDYKNLDRFFEQLEQILVEYSFMLPRFIQGRE